MRIWESTTEDALVTSPVQVGDQSEHTYEVTSDMVTNHVPGAPPVLSTPSMIACMEDTAARVLRRRLVPDAAAVGAWIGVYHRAPALLGERVDVRATVVVVRGRHVTFDVEARVAGRLIGDGQVTQVLIRARP